jgi:hypothetical protein
MLPNLILIGAQKCGTTSLYDYLRQHPAIFMSRTKELKFFCASEQAGRDRAWYEAQFPVDRPVRGEASPQYTNFPFEPGVPARMHALLPQARLIYLVREPVARILSHYVHWIGEGQETRSLAAALADFESSPYVTRSRYAWQLEQYLAFYPREQVLVISTEELRDQRAATLRRVFQFLGVDDSFTCARFDRQLYRARDQRQLTSLGRGVAAVTRRLATPRWPPGLVWRLKSLPYPGLSRPVPVPVMPPKLAAAVREFLRPDRERLCALTGRDFSAWEAS